MRKVPVTIRRSATPSLDDFDTISACYFAFTSVTLAFGLQHSLTASILLEPLILEALF